MLQLLLELLLQLLLRETAAKDSRFRNNLEDAQVLLEAPKVC